MSIKDQTLQSWNASNWNQLERSEKEINRCENLIRDVDMKIREISEDRLRVKTKTENEMEKKVFCLSFWKKEIENTLDSLLEQSKVLDKEAEDIQTALDNLESPQKINHECRCERERRLEEDLVADEVQYRLIDEAQIIEESKKDLSQCKTNINEEIRLIRKNITKLQKDINLKDSSLSAEQDCLGKVSSIERKKSEECIKNETDEKFIPTAEWERKNRIELERAKAQVCSAVSRKKTCEQERRKVRYKMFNSLSATNREFVSRLHQSREAKLELQNQLFKTNDAINTITSKLEDVKTKIEDQKPQQHRTDERINSRIKMRSNRERCFDTVQSSLISESALLEESQRKLEEICGELEKELRQLRSRKVDLTRRIEVKDKSISVDEKKCGEIRKGLEINNFVP